MTRLDMQQRIGAGPYRVSPTPEAFTCAVTIEDAHGCEVATLRPNQAQAVCDALNALWESAK